MNSCEIMKRAIRFETPERIPVLCGSLGFSDRRSVGPAFHSDRTRNGGVGADHFGCVWARTEAKNMGQVKGHPLADWRALENYAWPDPDREEYYAEMPAKVAAAEKLGRFVDVGVFMLLFERMHALRGFEPTLADLYLEPDLSAELADRLVEFDLRVIENCASAVGAGRIHSFAFTDDWGTQQNSFVSPGFWREFFAPRYRRIFDAAHRHGWSVYMHSCGKINDIIEPLIEIGLDVINLQQPRALGIEEIGRRYRGRICFATLCDIQATLPFKGAEAIREEARLLLEHWATPEGGLILAEYGDDEAIGVPPGKKRLMAEAFLELDPWAARSGRRAELPVPEAEEIRV